MSDRRLAPVLFLDRRDAGRQLAQRLLAYRDRDAIVLAIPRGGVPVGYEVSQVLGCPLDIVVPRKLPIPWSPEAGFGAVTPDGTRVLNEHMVRRLGLSAKAIDEIAAGVLIEVRRREAAFRGDRPPPAIAGRAAILIDDGLASGYTMIAAVRATRKHSPSSIIVAVPVSPRDSANEVARDADDIIAIHISTDYPFAVASFYQSFPDLKDEEVTKYLTPDRAGPAG